MPNTRDGGFHPPTAQHALREGAGSGGQRRGDDSGPGQETVSLLDLGTAGGDRPANGSREHLGNELLGLHRLVAMEDDLLEQIAAPRKESPRRARLDARSVLRQGFCRRNRKALRLLACC
jgi:hypothetical protein